MIIYFNVNEEKRIARASIFAFLAFLLFGYKNGNSGKYMSLAIIVASLNLKFVEFVL